MPLVTSFDPTPDELQAAYALRTLCFQRCSPRLPAALDRDRLDLVATHVIVSDTVDPRRPVVGHVRLLDRPGAQGAGGFRTQRYYDIGRLLAQPGRIAEVGRVCTHPDYRAGRVMDALFGGIYAYLVLRRIDYLFGVADLWVDDLAHARAMLAEVLHLHQAPRRLRFDAPPLPEAPPLDVGEMRPPALLRAYMGMGAYLAEELVEDGELGGYAVGVLLDTRRLPMRVRTHYGGALLEGRDEMEARRCLA